MIKRITLKKQAYDFLLHAITEEEIKPKEVYSEQHFANLLNISRTPIREAVLQLSQEGFLQIHPNKGFSVKPSGDKELEEIFQLRCAIEGFCAMNAARLKDTAEGRNLVSQLSLLLDVERKSYENNESASVWMENDTKFHSALITFVSNSLFTETMGNLRAKIKMTGMRSLYKEGRKANTMAEHERILQAIISGDEMKAYNAIKEHFDECKAIIRSDRN